MPAAHAGLVYVDDCTAGWRRVRRGRGFAYLDEQGRPIRAPGQLDRIRSLAIPPAYTDVWICPDPAGHLQATGRDAKGRKQYRYHRLWKELRNQAKFDRLLEFGHALPTIRRAVARDLAHKRLSLDTVTAAIVRLLDRAGLRVGNDEYSARNGSYGLTTLRHRHAKLRGNRLMLHFKGKSQVEQQLDICDGSVARIARRCQELPGQRLILVGIHLGQAEAALVLGGKLLQDRAEAAAGPAPRCPEVDEDGEAVRCFDDFLQEVAFGDVDGVLCHIRALSPAVGWRRVRGVRCW